jgi:hypothetical protein
MSGSNPSEDEAPDSSLLAETTDLLWKKPTLPLSPCENVQQLLTQQTTRHVILVNSNTDHHLRSRNTSIRSQTGEVTNQAGIAPQVSTPPRRPHGESTLCRDSRHAALMPQTNRPRQRPRRATATALSSDTIIPGRKCLSQTSNLRICKPWTLQTCRRLCSSTRMAVVLSTLSEIEKSCGLCWREKFLADNRRSDATRYGASKAMFRKREHTHWLFEQA